MTIRAIETAYKGYKFKSRLEYRWAVFFDTIGVSWFYEYEGFDLGNGLWYLPDFYIPKWGCYFEAKNPGLWPEEGPDYNQQKELEKIFLKSYLLEEVTQSKCIVAFGGFSPNNMTQMIVFMPGFNLIGYYLVGYGVFGNSNGTDVLYLKHEGIPISNKTELAKREEAVIKQFNKYTYHNIPCGTLFQYLYGTIIHKREYIIPLSHSIGQNFVIAKDNIIGKIFAAFSHYLFCNFNAQEIKGYKPYTKAYTTAKNANYGDNSVN